MIPIHPFLRWHYPDQVHRSAAEFSALSAWLTPSSRFSHMEFYTFNLSQKEDGVNPFLCQNRMSPNCKKILL